MQSEHNPIELQITALIPATKQSSWSKIFRQKPIRYHLTLAPKEEMETSIVLEIGDYEAQGIAVILQGMTATRPLMPDLFKQATDQFGYNLDSAILHTMDENGIYHAKVYYSNNERTVTLDARPSDAITLALKSGAPIYMDKTLLERNVTQAI